MTNIFQILWLRTGRRHHRFFLNHIDEIQETQKTILLKYLHKNKNSTFGQQYGFKSITSIQDYQKSIPIIEDYETLRPYIQQIADGEKHILTEEKILFFESTSGSLGSQKWIPYTKTLKNEIEKYVGVWMNEMYISQPSAFKGKSYWSLSPPLKEQSITPGGIKIGTDKDEAYFNPISRWFLRNIMAVNQTPLDSCSSHEFYLKTSRQLLATKNLSFISVWSPNFIIQLDQFIRKNLNEITDHPIISKNRREEILSKEFQWSEIFPLLKILSCWTDAQAALWMPKIHSVFKGIEIQSKGLLSTEGVISLPTRYGNALAYTCQFYEFRCIKTKNIFLSHQLEVNLRYEVIITTGGGLYRYNTKDIIEVIGLKRKLPILKFVGRSTNISDLVGEKLDGNSFNELLHEIKANHKIGSLLFQAVKLDTKVFYKVLVFTNSAPMSISGLCIDIESYLCKNPYYLQARNIGQLSELVIELLEENQLQDIAHQYAKTYSIKDGDLKLPMLLPIDFSWNKDNITQ